ncbi:MAG TPA: uracil-DNA glycosylase family protein [Pyrinomonadaceae bacterium]|nr:uracil-DNA glycosylase family protein [Pyrinomonadaceae bacterium]
MADDASRAEFLSLVEELGNQLSYLRELGVEGVAAGNFAATPVRASRDENAPLRKSPAATAPASNSHALRRNAEAESRQPPAEVSPAPRQPPTRVPPPQPPARHETPNVLYQTAPEPNDMATRKPVRKPSANPPAPRETLFGEITPQDELSLPRPGETLESIKQDIGECMRCPLCCEARHTIVHSEGNPKARLMFVGEAPGADEDASGRPFVGRAGQLLNKIIEAIGLKREDVFIGNVNRCRPLNNRTPTMAEAATCKPFLLREIAIVRPDVIVVLGNTAMKNLLDTKEGITKLRGKFQDYKGIKVMPTFHPAYLLRDPSKKRETWEDMKTIRDYLARSKPEK